MLELWGPRSNRVSELSRAFQCGLLVRTMPYRTTFDPARGGQTEPASPIRCVDEILRIRRPDRADGVAVSVCQLCLFRSAQIHYVNLPGTSFFATEREPSSVWRNRRIAGGASRDAHFFYNLRDGVD